MNMYYTFFGQGCYALTEKMYRFLFKRGPTHQWKCPWLGKASNHERLCRRPSNIRVLTTRPTGPGGRCALPRPVSVLPWRKDEIADGSHPAIRLYSLFLPCADRSGTSKVAVCDCP